MTISRRDVLAGAGVGMAALAAVRSSAAVLPQGLDRGDFMVAVGEFRALLGDENVIVDEERLAPYEMMSIPGPVSDYQPAGALVVNSVEQVQGVLAICNRHIIPVWPISTGFNRGYGDRLPAVPGQMVLDMGRMNKILDIDAELCTALVEPGTTYRQLYEYLTVNNIPLWLSVPGPGPLVGPMGQAMERGQGYTSLGDQFESICGMEVVLADGTVLRTGMGGIPGTTAWQAYKPGYGPALDGIFTQSNFGIVTKLGLWLMPKPETVKMFAVSWDNLDDVGKAIDASRKLKLANTVEGPILTGIPISQIQMSSTREEVKKDEGPITKEWFKKYAKEKGMPLVACFGSVVGSTGEVDAKYAEVKRIYHEAGGSVVDDRFIQFAPIYKDIASHMTGIPHLGEMHILNWVPGGGITWVAFVAAARGKEVKHQIDLGWEIMEKYGFDFNSGFFGNGRSALNVMAILFDKSDDEQSARAKACAAELLDRFGEHGYAPYRAAIPHMARTAEIYGAPKQATNLKIKKALDPNGIIGRGKSGILSWYPPA